jgi:hypothetical protein
MELAQAIPSDSVAYALASSSAFAAEMASSLSVGNTPTWYAALPSDVKSLLPQIYPVVEPTPEPSSSAYAVASSSVHEVVSSTASPSSKDVITPYPTSGNGTSVTVSTVSATGSAIGSSATLNPSGAPSSPEFEGAATRLSTGAAMGAIVMGFIGMLAL